VKTARTALWRLRSGARVTPLRKIWVWRRHLGLEPTDTFLACYPRSGSNWVQFLVYQSLTNTDPTFESVRQFSPYLGGQRKALRLLPGGGRFVKTHEPYQKVYRRGILLIRDPRDVVLSDFRFLRMRGDYVAGFPEFVTQFINGRAHGFGSWKQQVETWLNSGLEHKDLLKIRFEDLHRDPPSHLAGILAFLGIDSTGLDLQTICGNNSIERMRAKEDLGEGAPSRRDARYRFVNRGLVGEWAQELTADQIEQIEETFASTMRKLSYLNWQQEPPSWKTAQRE
jgi:hypothetical protein